MQSAQKSDLAPLFGDLSQSEKLSEIKPPLPSIPYHFQLELSISCALFSKPKEVTSSIVEKSNRLNDFRFFFTKWLTGFCLIPKITAKKKSWCNDQFSISTEFNFKSHDMQWGRLILCSRTYFHLCRSRIQDSRKNRMKTLELLKWYFIKTFLSLYYIGLVAKHGNCLRASVL